MGRTFHLVLLDHGSGLENATVFAGTKFDSAAEDLHCHLVTTWPDEDWSDDAHGAIERLNRDGGPINKHVHHIEFDLGQALAHEDPDGLPYDIMVLPRDAYMRFHSGR